LAAGTEEAAESFLDLAAGFGGSPEHGGDDDVDAMTKSDQEFVNDEEHGSDDPDNLYFRRAIISEEEGFESDEDAEGDLEEGAPPTSTKPQPRRQPGARRAHALLASSSSDSDDEDAAGASPPPSND
jgi:hypothetical protein